MKKIFKSSAGFLDLSTIMAGVIAILLIGGVVAATIFAAIPWSKDNTAKKQAETIHAAESAFYSLSLSSTVSLVGNVKESFGDSSDLENNNLLTKNDSYCVTTLADGKDYQLWVKSASGKIFTSTSNDSIPTVSKNFPCHNGNFVHS